MRKIVIKINRYLEKKVFSLFIDLFLNEYYFIDKENNNFRNWSKKDYKLNNKDKENIRDKLYKDYLMEIIEEYIY